MRVVAGGAAPVMVSVRDVKHVQYVGPPPSLHGARRQWLVQPTLTADADNFSRAVSVSTHGRCRVWLRFSEFSGVVLGCFTLTGSTIYTDVSLNQIRIKTHSNPLFMAVLYSVSWVRKKLNG